MSVCLVAALLGAVGGVPVALRTGSVDYSQPAIRKRSPSVEDRPGCVEGATPPPNRVNTTQRLADLRRQMQLFQVNAYIVTSDNAHQVI